MKILDESLTNLMTLIEKRVDDQLAKIESQEEEIERLRLLSWQLEGDYKTMLEKINQYVAELEQIKQYVDSNYKIKQ